MKQDADPRLSLGVDAAGASLVTFRVCERRRSTLDIGLARLAGHLVDLAGSPLEELCDALLDRMLQGTPQDDVALVAMTVGWEPGAPGHGWPGEQRPHRLVSDALDP